MSEYNDSRHGNVIPIRKSDSFGVYLGEITSGGEVVEGECVGIAYLKPGSKKFRLKLFVFPSHQYFIMPDDKDDTKYVVLSLEEYQLPTGETRTSWNRIGNGRLLGSFIVLRIQLLPENIFLCLFPEKNEPQEDHIAS
ncbi:MAG: hypothetical protein AB7K41_04775 [Bdellovibrionales bacterium]